jgi:penicillin-binding protein 2
VNPVTRRLRILLIVLIALHGVVLVRVFAMQVIDGGTWRDRAEQQQFQVRRLVPHRGAIMDRYGRALATEEPGYNVTVVSTHLDSRVWRCTDCLRTVTMGSKTVAIRCRGCGAPGSAFVELTVPRPERYAVIARLLERTPEEVEARIRETVAEYEKRGEKRKLRGHNPVYRDVPLEVAREIHLNGERTPELRVSLVRLRYMHHPTHLAHVLGVAGSAWSEDLPRLADLGFTKYDAYRLSVGHSGLEQSLEKRLLGQMGEQRVLVDHAGVVLEMSWDRPPKDGENVRLTIDLELQAAAERALDTAGLPGAFVALDPRNGEILALATAPRFNLATLGKDYDRLKDDPTHPMLNRPVDTAEIPGSVFKIVTAIGLMKYDTLQPEDKFTCSGAFVRGMTKIKCSHEHGAVDLRAAIEKSCNVYFIHAGMTLGRARLEEICRELGLGAPTGSELGETSGRLPIARRAATPGRLWLASFGQGPISTTPIQMARVAALVANGGRLVRPTLLLGMADPTGVRIVSESDLEPIRDGMRRVVHGAGGSARRHGLQEHRAAAKTGTGERGIRRGIEEHNNGWMIGYAPHDAPRIAFACYIENTEEFGGTVCGPIVKQWLDAWAARR